MFNLKRYLLGIVVAPLSTYPATFLSMLLFSGFHSPRFHLPNIFLSDFGYTLTVATVGLVMFSYPATIVLCTSIYLLDLRKNISQSVWLYVLPALIITALVANKDLFEDEGLFGVIYLSCAASCSFSFWYLVVYRTRNIDEKENQRNPLLARKVKLLILVVAVMALTLKLFIDYRDYEDYLDSKSKEFTSENLTREFASFGPEVKFHASSRTVNEYELYFITSHSKESQNYVTIIENLENKLALKICTSPVFDKPIEQGKRIYIDIKGDRKEMNFFSKSDYFVDQKTCGTILE